MGVAALVLGVLLGPRAWRWILRALFWRGLVHEAGLHRQHREMQERAKRNPR